ncbi:MAG: phospholipid phosphatase [Actinomycetia bacterium]|nr:phospholipid phosphatase [Actinomycetes bacterium]
MDTILFLGFALAYLLLLVWGLALARRHGWWTPANLPLLVLAALVFDNAVIGLGRFIGDGPVLEALNLSRFWVHALVTPVLVAWALHTLRRAGFAWAQHRWFQIASIGAALALTVLEYVVELRDLSIVPREEYGTLSYTSAEPPEGPPIMVLIVALVLIVAGALLWWKQKWPWLLAGALLMTVGSAIEVPIDSGAATNAFELVLLISIMATKAFQDRAADAQRG